MAISPSYGVPDKLLHFIVAIFLDTFALVITAALADFNLAITSPAVFWYAEDMVLRFTVAAPPTNLSVWSVTISVVFLSEPKTILFIKAEFCELDFADKQPFTKKVT